MAILTYGPGLALSGLLADNSPAGVGNTIDDFNYLTLTTETSGLAVGDYRLLNNAAFQDVFYGSGFTYSSSGVPTGGVITHFQRFFDGQLVSDLSGTPISVLSLETWAYYGEASLAATTIFAGNDTIIGTSGNDILEGYGGNNTLIPGTGIDTLIGGSGISTVILPDTSKQDQISGSPMGAATVTGPDISDTLTSIDRIQFVDGTMYYDTASPAAQVMRMYQAALGRAADPTGLASWVAAMNGGGSPNQVAASFIGSTEFQTRFPGASQNATALVTQLYANVLHRAPDQSGLSFWVGTLQSGAQTQAQVLAGFSESSENQGNTAGAVSHGIWVADEQAASAARLYYTALGRAPDAAGLIYWTNAIESGAQTLQQEAGGFAGSAEFQQKYGALSNVDFVNLMYTNVLGRPADGTGLAYWAGALNTGGMSRADVVVGFSQSSEHQIDLASKIEASGILLA